MLTGRSNSRASSLGKEFTYAAVLLYVGFCLIDMFVDKLKCPRLFDALSNLNDVVRKNTRSFLLSLSQQKYFTIDAEPVWKLLKRTL